MGSPGELLVQAEGRLAREPSVNSVYVFGSRAGQGAGPDSDLDLAVILAPGMSAEERFWRRAELMEDLAAELGMRVDAIDLAAAPPMLAQEILLTGRLLFCKDDDQRVAVEVKIRQEYEDIAPYRRYYRREVLGFDGQRSPADQA